jgi:DNA-binding YbaB/EbfC family protein
MFGNLDMNNFHQMVDAFQNQAKEITEKTETARFVGKSGGGMVEVEINGKNEVLDIKIDDSLMEDKESLSILLIGAVNDALKLSEENKKETAMNMVANMSTLNKQS